MKTIHSLFLLAALAGVVAGSGCARRLTLSTGTVIGLTATPGDGQSQPPQITLAYKRAEMALVPTGGNAATNKRPTDAYSALAVIDFQTRWFRETSIDQFIATGHASRDIQTQGSEFTQALAQGGDVRDAVVEDQIFQALVAKGAADSVASLRVRDMQALGELEPDEYPYLDVSNAAPVTNLQKLAIRSATPDYNSFKLYRARLNSSISVLKSGATVKVTQLDGTERTLSGDALKKALANYERALAALQQQVANQGATRRALAYYFETLTR
jgi:hypothetical protein